MSATRILHGTAPAWFLWFSHVRHDAIVIGSSAAGGTVAKALPDGGASVVLPEDFSHHTLRPNCAYVRKEFQSEIRTPESQKDPALAEKQEKRAAVEGSVTMIHSWFSSRP